MTHSPWGCGRSRTTGQKEGALTTSHAPGCGMRRVEHALLLVTVVLATAGVLIESIWLLGLAAWALIAAGLIEMVYRP